MTGYYAGSSKPLDFDQKESHYFEWLAVLQ